MQAPTVFVKTLILSLFAFYFATGIKLRAQIYIEEGGAGGGISEYSLSGQLIDSNLVPVNTAVGFVLSNNLLYVMQYPSNANSEEIDVYNATSGALAKGQLATGFGGQNLLSISGDYLFDGNVYGINIYNASTGASVTSYSQNNVLISYAVSGNVVYEVEETHSATYQLDEINATTGEPIGNGPLIASLNGAASVAASGNFLYVCDEGPVVNGYYTAGTIKEYDATTGAFIETLVTGVNNPRNFILSNADFYVMTSLNGTPLELEEFSLSGQTLSTDLIPSGVGEAVDLQVAPEPFISTLLICAFAMASTVFIGRRLVVRRLT